MHFFHVLLKLGPSTVTNFENLFPPILLPTQYLWV